MITSIKLKNFRGFKDFAVSDLKPVTLLAGRNICGKTSLLEAVYILCNYLKPSFFVRINKNRGNTVIHNSSFIWDYLFNSSEADEKTFCIQLTENADIIHELTVTKRLNTSSPVDLAPDGSPAANNVIDALDYAYYQKTQDGLLVKDQGSYLLQRGGIIRNSQASSGSVLRSRSAELLSADYEIYDLAVRLGQIELKGQKEKLIDCVNIIDSDIEDLILIMDECKTPEIFAKYKNHKLIPVSMAGHGLKQLLKIALSFLDDKVEVLLIDEIERGFHYSVFPDLWKALTKLAAEFNKQLIASTHSADCIENFYQTFSSEEIAKLFKYVRLERDENGDLVPTAYNSEEFISSLDYKFEVR
ncbi:MAG: AAA family ATPase [Proteobacteria bacterium]|uniref:AAA family ATPase n=1 Tax=Candidatus Avisuccinivibrio stercorigallinarum TaxID=2840704 RepID=A0A9D9DBU5_9GAMM|nr:AAA family ATPase [Candidatus Avisuccinivibrio stercorigallinarum]